MPTIIVGTAGHIDHGKSSLVLALTGTDPDRLKEEKARGITIDLGFAHWSDDEADVAFVDVPGHERFVRNMLAGAGGIDAALLVVSADESVMPQTREHYEICRLLGVTRGIVAITKCDLVDDEMLALVRLEVQALVEGSPLESAPIVAVSSRTGAGLNELKEELRTLARSSPPRSADGPARLPIDRAFTVKGFGTVVTGTLVSGRIRPDEELTLLPGDRAVKVRGIQVHGRPCDVVEAGRRVALNIGAIEVSDIARGQVLAAPHLLAATRVIDTELELLDEAVPLRHGTRVRLHQGTAEVLGRVGVAGEGGLQPGGGFARIRLERAIVVTRGDRFILRAYSPVRTIGGGVVLDPQAPRGGVRRPGSRERFETLGGSGPADADRAIAVFLQERGARGLDRPALVARTGLGARALDAALARLSAAAVADDIGGVVVSRAIQAELALALQRLVREHHRSHPLADGLSREEARERLFAHAPQPLFEHVLADLARRRALVGRDRLAEPGHSVSLTTEETRAREAIVRALDDAALAPPEPSAIAQAEGIAGDVLARVLALLVRQRDVVKIDTLYFHQRALEGLKRDVQTLKEEGTATVDVAAFKVRYGLSRKYAIPLLEYLDRERVTRRVGDARRIL